MPLLSVITVNLNNVSGLKKTIDSVLSQVFTDLEFIIVDGASVDESIDIIKSYSDKISFWTSEKDTGIFNAMNKGIRKATGEYLIFLNSGDYFYDETVLDKIFKSDLQDSEIIFGDTLFQYNDAKLLRKNAVEKLTFEYLIEDDINHQSCFIKRSLFDKFGLYDESLKIAADHKFFLNVLILHNTSYKYFNTVISVYNMHGISAADVGFQLSERNAVQHDLFPDLIYDLYKSYKELVQEKKSSKQKIMHRFKRVLKKIITGN
jgi:glycosyltransferase involved in cell wall biosynthesis